VGRSAQNGRNGDSFPEKYCGYFSFEAATQRVSGDPPKHSAPSTHTPSTGRACGRAFGPTVVIVGREDR
jgi:hypothetical protein